jgi:CRISPR-associated protein (TIGR02710 family)
MSVEFAGHAVLGEYIVENQFEVLNACYRTLRQQIPQLLHKHGIAPESVLVDYTGGSKPMSAALVLAATEFFQNFAYVGGERDKDGVGRTLPGQEQLVEQTTNPWAVLAVRELGRIADLWRGLQFEAAASLLRHTAGQVPKINKVRFQTFAKVADAMAARHRLDLREARALLEGVHNPQEEVTPMRALFDGREDFELLSQLESIQGVMRKCLEHGGANATLLRELLDNALRTASQGRYEDAAARLYRALEMQGQLWLKETSRGFFESGRCKADKVEALFATFPELDREQWGKTDREGRINLGLEQLFRCLCALKDVRAQRIVEDMDAKGSRIRAVTKSRNEGILAHGVASVGKSGFEEMKKIAQEFFGMDLSKEQHPMLDLDLRWLAMD